MGRQTYPVCAKAATGADAWSTARTVPLRSRTYTVGPTLGVGEGLGGGRVSEWNQTCLNQERRVGTAP